VAESEARGGASQDEASAMSYPTQCVVAVLDTQDQARRAVETLLGGAFLESEVHVSRGAADADRLASGTGRQGLQDWFIRLTGSVGLKNAETELKERYEAALRDDKSVVAVLAPTDARKDIVVGVLRDCGGQFINYFGRLSVERIG
jgi:hypothetical protein